MVRFLIIVFLDGPCSVDCSKTIICSGVSSTITGDSGSSYGASSTATVVTGSLPSSSTVCISVTSCTAPFFFLIIRFLITVFLATPSSVFVSITVNCSGLSSIAAVSASSTICCVVSSTVTVVTGARSSCSTVCISVTSSLVPVFFLMIRFLITVRLGRPLSVFSSRTVICSGNSVIVGVSVSVFSNVCFFLDFVFVVVFLCVSVCKVRVTI